MSPLRRVVIFASVAVAIAACGTDAAHDASATGQTAAVRRLETRPLSLPAMPADGRCPLGLTVSTTLIAGAPGEAGLGPGDPQRFNRKQLLAGPVYGVLSAVPRVLNPIPDFHSRDYGERWPGAEMTWISRPRYRGPVLVRGGRLDGDSRLAFGSASRRKLRLILPAGTWDERKHPPLMGGVPHRRAPAGWRSQPVTVRAPSTGCYAFQVDGIGFSYPLVFEVVVNPPDPR